MKDQKYDLESLIVTFAEHAIKAEVMAEEAEENSNGESLDFNVATALHRICLEIQALKILKSE